MFLDHFISVDSQKEYTYDELREQFRINPPENFNYAFDVVDAIAQDSPDRRALVWCDDHGGERIFTFGELAKEVNKTANYLASIGVGKGDRVMMILRRRYEVYYFFLALHKLGAIVIPATNMLLAKDLVYRNNAAEVNLIVSFDDKVQDEIEASLAKSPTVKTLITVGSDRPNWHSFHKEYATFSDVYTRRQICPGGHDPMLLYFTSGTSGYPKMVQHSYLYPLGHICTAKYWQRVVEGGLHLSIAESGWGKFVWGKLYGQLLCGTAVFTYDMDSFVPGKVLEKMARYGVTTFCAPPTVYRYLIRQDLRKYDMSHLVFCSTAGEALNGEVYDRFLEQTGLKIHEGFGQTETTLCIGNFPGMEPKSGSMGKPAPGYDVDIVHPNGTPVEPNEHGEIIIRLEHGHPCGLFSGYYHDVSLTAAAFDNDVYHTGDVAFRDEDGYYYFVGRNDDLIKTSGYRVSPFEVESSLQKHPAVLECAVTGVEDPKRGQAVKATVVLCKGFTADKALQAELIDFVKHDTASYKAPRIIEFVEELPKTISGKIRRVEIRDRDKKIVSAGND